MSFIDLLEEVVEEASDWATEQVQVIVDLLAPDGRPFGMEEKSDEEQLAEYQQLRGQPEAWAQWIQERVDVVVGDLATSGVDPEKIAGIKPYAVVEAYALKYSARMEKLSGE